MPGPELDFLFFKTQLNATNKLTLAKNFTMNTFEASENVPKMCICFIGAEYSGSYFERERGIVL